MTRPEQAFVQPLDATEARASSENGWRYVPMPASTFNVHGYCSTSSWFTSISEALSQGTFSGILHPNREGHLAMAKALYARVIQDLYTGDVPRVPLS